MKSEARDDVYQCQARRRRPAGVQAEEHIGIDVFAAPAHELQPPPSEPCASPQQPDHRGAGAAGEAQPHALDHAPKQIEPAIDVPAGEELLRGPSLQLHLPGVSRSRRGAQVGVGRLGRPAGIGERGREPFSERVSIG